MAEVDPLLVLLQRYQVERQAFDDAGATAGITNEDWDKIARATWWGTQTTIIESKPSAVFLILQQVAGQTPGLLLLS